MTYYQKLVLTLDSFPGDLRISVKGMLNDSIWTWNFARLSVYLRLAGAASGRVCVEGGV
jgi:hypothetical protein